MLRWISCGLLINNSLMAKTFVAQNGHMLVNLTVSKIFFYSSVIKLVIVWFLNVLMFISFDRE